MMRSYNSRIIPKLADKSDRMYIVDVENQSPDLFLDDVDARTLIKEYQDTEDYEKRSELVHNYGKYVVSIAKNYQDQGLPLSDLISEGMVGLLNAIDKFDLDNQTKFVTYSNTVISRQIRDALDEFNYPTKVPKNIRNEINKARELKSRLSLEGKDVPEMLEYIDENNSDDRLYGRYVNYIVNPGVFKGVSMSTKMSDGDDSYTMESFFTSETGAPDTGLTLEDLRSDLDRIFASVLSDQEVSVINLYYGLNRKYPVTSTEEIGKHLGLTGERARQLKESGLKKLKDEKCKNILIKYLG